MRSMRSASTPRGARLARPRPTPAHPRPLWHDLRLRRRGRSSLHRRRRAVAAERLRLVELLGEWFAADAPRHYVLRVESLLAASDRRSSIYRIVDASGRSAARVFTDRIGDPELRRGCGGRDMGLIESAAPAASTMRHSGVTSGRAGGGNRPCARRRAELVPVRMAEVPMKARRPLYPARSNENSARRNPDARLADALRRHLGPRLLWQIEHRRPDIRRIYGAANARVVPASRPRGSRSCVGCRRIRRSTC